MRFAPATVASWSTHPFGAIRRRRRLLAGVLGVATVAALAALATAPAAAQYFGRNRAVWTRFDWQVLRTAHCNVNFYQGEDAAARAIGERAEAWYGRLAAAFGAPLGGRIEVLVYANLADFQQTTLTPERLDPDRAPLDPRRRRMRLPLTGDGDHDDRQLGHELVQIFQQEMQGRQRVRQAVAGAIGRNEVPLWMDDGLADYLTIGRDSVAASMWLRDAMARGALPDLGAFDKLPRDVGERWGHAFWAFVGGRFGDRAAMQLYGELTRLGLSRALRQVLRLDEGQLAAQWYAAIDAAYGSFVAAHSGGGQAGERRIPRGRRSADRFLAPALSPDGSRVVYFSTRGWFGLDLDLADAATGAEIGRLFSSGDESGFDALRFADSAATWSPDGKRLALAMFRGGEDRIVILDADGGHVQQQLVLASAGALSDPAWSPDGSTIAVVGSQGGSTALWLVQVAGGTARRLADGCGGAVRQPAWSLDGKLLAFACQDDQGGRSDQGDEIRQIEKGVELISAGPWRIRLLDLPAGTRPRLAMPAAASGADQLDPAFGPAGDLYFVSPRGGVPDVYRWDAAAGTLFQVTDVVTGVAGLTARSPSLAVAARSGRVMFSLFTGGSWEIDALDSIPAGKRVAYAERAAAESAKAGKGAGAPHATAAATAAAEGEATDAEAAGIRLSLLPPATGTTLTGGELNGALPESGAGLPAAGTASSTGTASRSGTAAGGARAGTERTTGTGATGRGATAVAGPTVGTGPAAGSGTAAAGGGSAGAPAAPATPAAPTAGSEAAAAAAPVVPYRSRLALEDISPGLGVGYSSLGYAASADISARMSDVVNHYQISADVQGGISAFPEYGGSILFLDTSAPLQWGVQVGHVPSVSGFAQVSEVPPAGAGQGPPGISSIAIDQIFELITQDQAEVLLQYPFSPTERIQASVSYNHLSFEAKDVREVLTGTQLVETSRFNLANPPSLTLFQGGLAFIGDTSLMGDTSPVRGQRYRAEVSATSGDLSFEQVTADYRRYFLFRPLTLAVRALHLGRYGEDANSPHLLPLFIGDPTLVRGYELGSLSASECRPPGGAPNTCPQFDRLVGSRLAVVNLELRLPLFGKDNLALFELRLLPTELALFVDAGTAWSAHQAPVLHLATDSDYRIPVASSGIAARFLVAGVAVAQIYVAKPFERPQRGAVTGIVISPGW